MVKAKNYEYLLTMYNPTDKREEVIIVEARCLGEVWGVTVKPKVDRGLRFVACRRIDQFDVGN